MLLSLALFSALSGCGHDEGASPHDGGSVDSFKSAYKPVKREYWIKAEVIPKWDIVPLGRSMMTHDSITAQRRYLHRAIRYVQTDAEWRPLPQPDWQQLSGPLLRATVGDSMVVHFKNASDAGMPLSIHPHNEIYDEKNEGIWRADRPEDWPDLGTAGGAVNPGDTFTYRWKAEERSAGVGPYHSHSFHPPEEMARGLIGSMVVDLPPDHPDFIRFDTTIALVWKTYQTLKTGKDTSRNTCDAPLIPWNGGCHPKEHVPKEQWPENRDTTGADTTGGGPEIHTINGLAYGNLPALRFKKGQRVRFVIFAMNEEGSQNHTAHFHGEMLRDLSRPKYFKDVFDLPSALAQELELKADNVGKWMIHCHVEHHASEMMAMYEITEADGSLPDPKKNNGHPPGH